jgi:hypothetical protein
MNERRESKMICKFLLWVMGRMILIEIHRSKEGADLLEKQRHLISGMINF